MDNNKNGEKTKEIFKATDELLTIYKEDSGKIYGYLVNFNKPSDSFPSGKGLTKTDIEDICSDTFTRALSSISTYDPAKNKHGMMSWLYTIARNAALDFIEKKIPASIGTLTVDKDGLEKEGCTLDYVAATDFSPEENSEIALRQARLDEAINTLPPEIREIYKLRTGKDNLSYREMSERFGKSENALRSTFKRANDKIIAMMQEYDQTLKEEIKK